MTSSEVRREFLRYFEERGHRVVPSSPLVVRNDPTLLFRQRRDEPVQGRVHRARPAGLRARRRRPEVPPRLGQAQRSRAGGTHPAPPHVLRDAGELLVRRLLQARRDRLGLGSRDRALRPARRSAVGHRLRWTEAVPADDEALPVARPRRRRSKANPETRRGGQLLAHGRHRPVRPVQRDPRTTSAPS
jgi:hypothetical protein